jgi:hypothetical protein
MLEAFHLAGLYNATTSKVISDEDLWRTMIGNRTESSTPAEAVYGSLFESFKYWCQNSEYFREMAKQPLYDPDTEIGKLYRNAELFQYATVDIITSRKFGITQSGHPRILPYTAAIGDKVVIILGLSTPFIIRECPSVEKDGGEQKYVLVGECYLHNMVDGEGLKGRVVENLIFQ